MISSGNTKIYDVRRALLVGAALLTTGLLLSAWRWDVGQTLGISLMLFGLAFPFVDAYRAWQRDRARPLPVARRAIVGRSSRGNRSHYEIQSNQYRGQAYEPYRQQAL